MAKVSSIYKAKPAPKKKRARKKRAKKK